MFCMTIGSCSMCKILVTKYHLLQFGMLRGKMVNSPTCPSQLAPVHHFVLLATRINMKAFGDKRLSRLATYTLRLYCARAD